MTTIKITAPIRNAKTLDGAIKKAKAELIKRAAKKGLYENFGDAERQYLFDTFITTGDFSNAGLRERGKITKFAEWAGNYEVPQA